MLVFLNITKKDYAYLSVELKGKAVYFNPLLGEQFNDMN